MNKKRLFGTLLGGGVTTLVASFGGLKLNDKISYNRKVFRLKKVAKNFKEQTSFGRDSYYLPDYEDDEAWQATHNSKYADSSTSGKTSERAVFLAEYPDWKTFKESCYGKAEKGFDDCRGGWNDWCGECARGEDWELERSRRR